MRTIRVECVRVSVLLRPMGGRVPRRRCKALGGTGGPRGPRGAAAGAACTVGCAHLGCAVTGPQVAECGETCAMSAARCNLLPLCGVMHLTCPGCGVAGNGAFVKVSVARNRARLSTASCTSRQAAGGHASLSLAAAGSTETPTSGMAGVHSHSSATPAYSHGAVLQARCAPNRAA